MRKELIGIAILLMVSCTLGTMSMEQEVNQQGWKDFDAFVGLIGSTDSAIQNLFSNIVSLGNKKVEIMDNPARKAEIKKIIDLHPDYDLDDITAKLTKLEALKNYLIDNGYIE